VPLNILLLGPQGAGKGTQAMRISSAYGIPHIATGDMLRVAIGDGTELGRRVEPIMNAGELVPDELMVGLIRERLREDDTEHGFILDGFPRTIAQAEALDTMFGEIGRPFSVVFVLQIPDEVAHERLSRRARIEGRVDDTPEVIRTRLENYHRETEPLIEYYRARGRLVPIRGERTENEVFAAIDSALEQFAAGERPVRDSARREGASGALKAPVRESGPVEGVRGNREVPPATAEGRRR
jgi:adenylate kinase